MAKSWWQKFIDKLADANKKEYGNNVPNKLSIWIEAVNINQIELDGVSWQNDIST